MIDAKAFGAELADIVKSQTAPLLKRIADLEKALAEQPEPEEIDIAQIAQEAVAIVAARLDQMQATIDEMPELEVPELPELPDIPALIDDAVKAAVDALPAPENGKDGRDGMDGEKGDAGADGVGLAGAFIDRAGELTVTLTNGETRSLGCIVGKDGAPGADGIGFDDMAIEHDGEREFTFRFERGAKKIERSFTLPVMLDRGVFSEGKDYAQGDVVSFGGSMWVAQKDASERPGTGDGWRLSVKKGRDGKDGVMKEPEEPKPVKVG